MAASSSRNNETGLKAVLSNNSTHENHAIFSSAAKFSNVKDLIKGAMSDGSSTKVDFTTSQRSHSKAKLRSQNMDIIPSELRAFSPKRSMDQRSNEFSYRSRSPPTGNALEERPDNYGSLIPL